MVRRMKSRVNALEAELPRHKDSTIFIGVVDDEGTPRDDVIGLVGHDQCLVRQPNESLDSLDERARAISAGHRGAPYIWIRQYRELSRENA